MDFEERLQAVARFYTVLDRRGGSRAQLPQRPARSLGRPHRKNGEERRAMTNADEHSLAQAVDSFELTLN